MKNKGFTLTEMMGVIVILAILVIIAVPTYFKIVDTIKDNNLKSKLSYIESKAIEYANNYELEPVTITIAKLVNEGYLEQDSKLDIDNQDNFFKQIVNPKGGYLDCYSINITFENNEYHAEVIQNEEVNCDLAYQDLSSNKVKISTYEISDDKIGNEVIVKDKNSSNISENGWTNKDLLMYVSTTADIDKTKGVRYIGGGITETKKDNTWVNKETFTTSGNVFKTYTNEYYISGTKSKFNAVIDTNFKVVLFTTTNQILTQTIPVRIDQEKPSFTYTVDRKWTGGDKPVVIYASDGAGSGVNSVVIENYNTGTLYTNQQIVDLCLKNNSSKCLKPSDSKVSRNLSDGDWAIYIVDNVGNVSNMQLIRVSNIDGDVPDCGTEPISLVPKKEGTDPIWYNGSDQVKAYFSCNQESSKSGCVSKNVIYNDRVVSSGTGVLLDMREGRYNGEARWTVVNAVGTENNNCRGILNLNVDTTPPICGSNSIKGTTYTTTEKDPSGKKDKYGKPVMITVTKEKTEPYNGEWTNAEFVQLATGCDSDPYLKDGKKGSGCSLASPIDTSTAEKITKEGITSIPSTVTISDNAGNITECNNNAEAKIDRTAPQCEYPNDETVWTASDRTIYWGGKDLPADGVPENEVSGITADSKYSVTITDSNEYYYIEEFVVKDNAGNERTCPGKNVKVLVDKTNPGCTHGPSTSNSTGAISVKYYGYDYHSGINSSESQSGTITVASTGANSCGSTPYTIPAYTIVDNVGHKVVCPSVSDSVKFDTVGPVIDSFEVTSTNANYNATTINYKISGHDACTDTFYCFSRTNSSSGCSWTKTGNSTYASGNIYTYHSNSNINTYLGAGSGDSITFYAFARDGGGNISPVATATYTTYKYCSQYDLKDGTTCSKICDTGSYNRLGYDKFFTTHRCEAYDTSDGGAACKIKDCCSSVSYTDWSKCSKSCGGGTKTRKAWSTIDTSVRCYEGDSGVTKKLKAKCNTAACASGTTATTTSCSHPYSCDPWTCDDWAACENGANTGGCTCTQSFGYTCCDD